MAADITRTAADDATDALAALTALERELVNYRAHLERIRRGGELATALQARRSAAVAAGVLTDAVTRTHHAVCRLSADTIAAAVVPMPTGDDFLTAYTDDALLSRG
jgi:hypothetical protein